MGLKDNRRTGGNFLKIFGGKIVKEWKDKPSDGQVPFGKEVLERELSMGPNKGEIRYYIEFDSFEGRLVDVRFKNDEKFGPQIELGFQDVDENYTLTLPFGGSYGRDFLYKMKGIDYTKDVELTPYKISPGDWFKLTGRSRDKDKTGLSVSQDGEKIAPLYTKDQPNGLPQLIFNESKTKGTTVDSTAHDDFLYERLMEVSEALKKDGVAAEAPAPQKRTPAPKPEEKKEEESTPSAAVNDLPWQK